MKKLIGMVLIIVSGVLHARSWNEADYVEDQGPLFVKGVYVEPKIDPTKLVIEGDVFMLETTHFSLRKRMVDARIVSRKSSDDEKENRGYEVSSTQSEDWFYYGHADFFYDDAVFQPSTVVGVGILSILPVACRFSCYSLLLSTALIGLWLAVNSYPRVFRPIPDRFSRAMFKGKKKGDFINLILYGRQVRLRLAEDFNR